MARESRTIICDRTTLRNRTRTRTSFQKRTEQRLSRQVFRSGQNKSWRPGRATTRGWATRSGSKTGQGGGDRNTTEEMDTTGGTNREYIGSE